MSILLLFDISALQTPIILCWLMVLVKSSLSLVTFSSGTFINYLKENIKISNRLVYLSFLFYQFLLHIFWSSLIKYIHPFRTVIPPTVTLSALWHVLFYGTVSIMFVLFEVYWLSCVCRFRDFIKFGKNSAIIPSNFFLLPTHPLFRTLVTQMLVHLILSHTSPIICSFVF